MFEFSFVNFGVQELAPEISNSKLLDSRGDWRIKKAHEIYRAPL